jgi:hypothetical protein
MLVKWSELHVSDREVELGLLRKKRQNECVLPLPQSPVLSADLSLFSHSIWDKLTELGYGDIVEAVKGRWRLFGMQSFGLIPTFMISRKLTAGGMTYFSVIFCLCICMTI